MDLVFKHPAFDSAREKVKRAMEQLEKSQETLENSLYTCFKCESNNVLSIAKHVRSAHEGREHLYSTNAANFTINRGMDDHIGHLFRI